MSTPTRFAATVLPLAPPRREGRAADAATWSVPAVWKRYTLVQHAYLRTLALGAREHARPAPE